MADLKDTSEIQGLMSAVKDIMKGNQNLYQQDLERQFNFPGATTPVEEPVDEISGSDSEEQVEVSSEEPIEASSDVDVGETSGAEVADGEVADETGSEISQG
jgi:hypothetical protein